MIPILYSYSAISSEGNIICTALTSCINEGLALSKLTMKTNQNFTLRFDGIKL